MQESMSSHQLHSEHILPLKSSLLGGNAPTCFPCSYICNALTPGEQTHLHKCHRWSHTHTHTSIDSRLCEFIWCASFVVSTRWWLMQKTHGGIVLLTWFPLKCGIFCRLSPCRGYNAPVPAKKTPPLFNAGCLLSSPKWRTHLVGMIPSRFFTGKESERVKNLAG